MPRWFWTSCLLAAVCASAAPARAQTGENVLVVANEAVPGSVQIAERYVQARGVPAGQLLRLTTSTSPQVSRDEFEREIQEPVGAWLGKQGAQDRILYIVLTRGVPLRIAGSAGRNGTAASVDSELALLYRRLTGAPVIPNGPTPNPYFAGGDTLEGAKPFSHAAMDIYLVTRLDGFTVDDALALVERGSAPVKDGRILLDEPPSPNDVRGTWMEAAVARLEKRGFGARVLHDATSRALQKETGVLGYASWGSNDPALEVRQPDLAFVPGAIASMFLSSDARTFEEPPAEWKPSRTSLQGNFAGSHQMLVGDFVRAGVTGIAGQVNEPYLDGAVRPDVLFPAYVAGFNLAESFYLAMPYLSWQTVVVGDPLAAPFRTPSLTLDDPNPPLDPATELPARFSARRLTAVQRPGRSDDILKLMVKAETRLARGDGAGSIELFKTAVDKDPSSVAVWRAYGAALETVKQYDEASKAYRRVLDLDRNDVVSLNNLAYIIAVRQNRPDEALQFATRAVTLARNNPTVADTLGWIYHLTGNDDEALKLLAPASKALPHHAEVQLHAAVVFAATGHLEDAAKALKLATSLDPSLKDRAEARDVEQKIGGPADHTR